MGRLGGRPSIYSKRLEANRTFGRENFKLQEKDNPFPDTAAGRTEHRQRLDAAVKSVNESTALDLPPTKNKIIYHSTDKVFRDFDVSKTADFSVWFTDNVKAIKNGLSGASGKGIIVKRSIDESKLKLATRAEADKLTDDIKSIIQKIGK